MEKLNQELILKLREGKIAVENTGTKQQLCEVIKEACPKDIDCDVAENAYYIVARGLWSGNATTNLPSIPIHEFYVTENVLNLTYEELLRQNREMREAIKELLTKTTVQKHVIRELLMHPETKEEPLIDKLKSVDRFLDGFNRDLSDCLTSCNKGKE